MDCPLMLMGHQTEAAAWQNRAASLKMAINRHLTQGFGILDLLDQTGNPWPHPCESHSIHGLGRHHQPLGAHFQHRHLPPQPADWRTLQGLCPLDVPPKPRQQRTVHHPSRPWPRDCPREPEKRRWQMDASRRICILDRHPRQHRSHQRRRWIHHRRCRGLPTRCRRFATRGIDRAKQPLKPERQHIQDPLPVPVTLTAASKAGNASSA